jgi:hypothetical protein
MKKRVPIILVLVAFCMLAQSQIKTNADLYNLNTILESRAINFENPTGEPGQGGKSASNLGIGRKGSPSRSIKAHEEITMCDIKGSGTIRHIWIGGDHSENEYIKDSTRRKLLRSLIIRTYWDGQKYPSIECPLGDFMGLAHSKVTSYASAVHTVSLNGGLNFWLPMPFCKSARITLTNESNVDYQLYYQIDYTIKDQHNDDVGRLHVCFRRENPTTLKQDFEILPKRTGKGRFIGAVIGVRTLYPDWWGEGEIKMYLDGDTEFPTICGTGSEDWVCLSYCVQQTTFPYHGCNLNFKSNKTTKIKDIKTNEIKDMNREYVSMYRWHIPDPIYWKKECRIVIQQLGCCYYERDDDWSSAAFWYEPIPSAPLPKIPSLEDRIKDLDELFK